MSAEPRPVLLVAEVLEILPIERSALYRLFRSGKLPCRKLGGRTVVRRVDLEAFLAELPAADFTKSEAAA
ncbi:helix-turn-helix transcriptional regulator [Methylobacterium radiotolerans]|uniref:Prophage CP4-57 regulatory n=1 Tax=Methylobacterium radiotolerans (strain ATCC 27329 / DSM 1819 / JCM 2831 / NBRC 15690 / NCIMB 10815 / 0-1) TaxID=426355 RepID=B1MAB0_METRJ|nr:helix-turn-helix domain-containing protein [Methylobacterium radiotolerans]ACB28435.1 Prophage CP4-57 regulatory [Methylobacterium radiotolerans JCM 2831]